MSFIRRQLDPAEILGELLFGLIMVLTFTLGAALAGGHERGLILAAIGCNVAWGVIDGVLILMGSRYTRRKRSRLVRVVREARDETAALAAIRDEFELDFLAQSQPADREQVYRSVRALLSHAEPVRMGFTRDDFMTLVAVFVLVVLPGIPAALPFFFVDDPQLALRMSNALLLALLFVAGWRYARHVDMHPLLCASTLTALGMALVAIAIALGG